METADNPGGARGQSPAGAAPVGLLIVGGGIMGLWAAVKAERMGIDTLLVDAGTLGSGASGGLLGALMPHMPDRWSDKKQFQFDALVSLEAEIAALEEATGRSAGYRRCGRIIPLPKPHLRTIALGHSRDAESRWHSEARRFAWQVLDVPPQSGWVEPAEGASGFVFDTLAGRVSPRAFCRALAAFLKTARHVRIMENAAVAHIDPTGRATFACGETIAFGHCIVAAGHRSFPLLDVSAGVPGISLGKPVKGQAALLRAPTDETFPVVFLNGLYIVPHEGGHVAIGSTSEEEFEDASGTDARLEDLIARARQLVPALEQAPVVERWAGLRPKAIDRDPMIGPHPDRPRLIALTGGFKVSFGLAHRLADAALAPIAGERAEMPASFAFSSHIEAAFRKSGAGS